MKLKYFIIPAFTLCMLAYSYSQKPTRIENDEYIFWQPGVKIGVEDYQGSDQPEKLNAEELWKAMSTENISFKMVVDHPKDSAMRGALMEKVYVVPVFCKKTSYNLKKDTGIIKYDQLYFDIAELYSRRLRIDLIKQMKLYPNSYGLNIIKFPSNQRILPRLYRVMIDNFNRSVFFEKKEGSYEKARREIDSLLDVSKEFASNAEDCKRFLLSKPLSEEYTPVLFKYDSNTTSERIQK